MKFIFLLLILLVTYYVASECVQPDDWDDELDGVWDGNCCDSKPSDWDDELDGVWDGCYFIIPLLSNDACSGGLCDITQITSAPTSSIRTLELPSHDNDIQSIQTTLAKHEKSMYLCNYVAQAMLYGMDDTLKSEIKDLLQNQ